MVPATYWTSVKITLENKEKQNVFSYRSEGKIQQNSSGSFLKSLKVLGKDLPGNLFHIPEIP